MTEYLFGGFWRRAAAAFIDQIILGITYSFFLVIGTTAGIFGFSIYTYALEPEAVMRTAAGAMLFFHVFCLLMNMAYFTYFHGMTGQTPGKMAMGLKVIQASGLEMTFGVAFLRWVGYLVSSLCLFLGYIWVAFDPRKQGWHDKIAGTLVIVKRQKYLDKAGDI
ncbi:MAG: RDD family protein [Syntrophales bacterium]|nr:RDD family protein [Syntrophales bacterium]